jgi:hypothetical protein
MRPVEYPKSFYEVDKIIKENDVNCNKTNLFLPWHLYQSFPFTGKIIASPSKVFFQCRFVQGTNMEFAQVFDNNFTNQEQGYGYWLLNAYDDTPPANTGYIVLVKTLDWEDYDWLDENEFVEKVLENEELVLYKVR